MGVGVAGGGGWERERGDDSETFMTVERTIVNSKIKLISLLPKKERLFFKLGDEDYWEDEYQSSSSRDW